MGSPLHVRHQIALMDRLKLAALSVCVFFLVGIPLGVVLATMSFRSHHLHEFGAAALWGLASFMTGAVVAFLFSLPRGKRSSTVPVALAPSGNPAQDWREAQALGDKDSMLDINSNLEEVSDWLTKMIVGIGLVELKSIPRALTRLSVFAGQSIGSDAASLAMSVIIYFGALGFIASYLLGRMFFGPSFNLADQATKYGFGLESESTDFSLVADDIASAVDIITQAKAGKRDQSERAKKLITDLRQHLRAQPLYRRLNIVLGNLYGEVLQDLDQGIAVLQEFIRAKRMARQEDYDLADALFNVACFYAKKTSIAKDKGQAGYEDQTYEALEESFRLFPANLADAKSDPDLDEFRRSAQGQKLGL